MIKTSKKTTLGEYVSLKKSDSGKYFIVEIHRNNPKFNEDLWSEDEQEALDQFDKAESWLISIAVKASRYVEPLPNPEL